MQINLDVIAEEPPSVRCSALARDESLRAAGLVRTGPLVASPAARYAPLLRESDVAAFLGMGSTRKSRFDAHAAIVAFASGPDPAVELVPERGGWRV